MKQGEQISFARAGFDRFARSTKRANFLAEMDRIVPWKRLCAVVEPHYPKGEGGRPAIALERMLRIYFLQQWFNLSDPGVEEALCDSRAMEAFAGIDLGREAVPDETTVCKFRHLLERTGWDPGCYTKSTPTWPRAGCGSAVARLWTRRSSRLRVRRRIKSKNGIPR